MWRKNKANTKDEAYILCWWAKLIFGRVSNYLLMYKIISRCCWLKRSGTAITEMLGQFQFSGLLKPIGVWKKTRPKLLDIVITITERKIRTWLSLNVTINNLPICVTCLQGNQTQVGLPFYWIKDTSGLTSNQYCPEMLASKLYFT